ncbi:FAD-dependent oxidoreductase, partial [Listeria monocytogenes]|uniref:FAD-dependent oxidoreductase n=1 Tax=Listeria monocytogenes TaxID=1639 RepID=UPI0013C51D6D
DEMKTTTPVTPELIHDVAPDAVIIAPGATPLVVPIPGIEDAGVNHGVDFRDGKEKCGQKVLVVVGGMVGSDTAVVLGDAGHDVTVVDLRVEVVA